MNLLDKFYTKVDIARYCYERFVDIIKPNTKSLFIEPSAGDGKFLDLLEYDFLAVDIAPEDSRIKKLDFLAEKMELPKINKKNIFVIGNPPFGKRSNLAIKFINKSSEYAKTIGFILPIHFLKYSAQRLLNSKLKLIHSEVLPENSFTENGKDYNVRSVFQIWTELDKCLPNKRILTPPPTKHTDFDMWQYNNTQQARKYFDKSSYAWEFAVPRQGFYDYSIKITDEKELDPKVQWAFFKPNLSLAREILFERIDFEKLAKKNTAILGFGKADVISEYSKIKREIS